MTKNPQIPLPIAVGDRSSFANFYVGENTEVVRATRDHVLNEQNKIVYLYGPRGSGKSHLLYAAAREASRKKVACSYVSLLQFEDDTHLLEMVNVKHLVCVDDLTAWTGNLEKERTLFALFEQIRHAGGRMLISSEFSPEQSGLGLPDLISRLGSGLIYPIQPLSDEQNFQAIKLRAKQRGLKIADDVVRFLQNRSRRNTAELFAMLDRIDQASLIEKRRITIPFLQTILKN